jgi:hypothetical protein
MYPENQTITVFGKETGWPGMEPDGKFTSGSFGDPLVPPSMIPAETLNLVLDNLAGLIAGLGGVPANTGGGRLAEAVLNALAPLDSPAPRTPRKRPCP